jgi:L-aminopeptidase/D-esterase-like protein
MTITAVPGVEVGHYTDDVARTGVTVMFFPEPNAALAEVRGAAPATHELALLQPGTRIGQVQALVFTGGSAFGLSSVAGVVDFLEEHGRGHPALKGPVPIVPAAAVYDLLDGDPAVRPGPEQGRAAAAAASSAPVPLGRVGAGSGVMVAGWRGVENFRPGGLGSANSFAGEATVGALAVVNAVGDVFDLEGRSLTGGDLRPGPPQFERGPSENTTLIAVATDARVSRLDLARLLVRAHDAVGACIRPGHTRYDGDVAFAVSCGGVVADLDALGEATFIAVGDAIAAAID